MPKDNSRPLLTTSATDFALPNYNTAIGVSSPSSFSNSLDTASAPYQRQRRPSVLMPKSYLTEPRLASPLQSSFKFASAPSLAARSSHTTMLSTSASTGSSSSSTSESSTPNLTTDEDAVLDHRMARAYRSPPRRYASAAVDTPDSRPYPKRKLSFPPKQPRIAHLVEEARPAESEVKSEAIFQRLLAAEVASSLCSTPRTPHDRGRFPEEAVDDDHSVGDDSPSDDDDDFEAQSDSLFRQPSNTQPISIAGQKRGFTGDEIPRSLTGSPCQMDVDAPSCSPRSIASSLSQWRSTPPPPTGAMRSTKRKFDDRYDPYPAKRRAVSPSMSYFRDGHPALGSPRGSRPIAIPISIPASVINSAASSPSMAGQFPRPMSVSSSPTLRSSMALASPILRPLMRAGRDHSRDRGEQDIECAGDAVGGLSLS